MDGGGAALQQVLFFGLLLGGLYLLAIRPQRARARELAQVRASLVPGQRVITTAGLFGTVVSVDDEVVVLDVAPGVLLRFVPAAIVRVLGDEAADEQQP